MKYRKDYVVIIPSEVLEKFRRGELLEIENEGNFHPGDRFDWESGQGIKGVVEIVSCERGKCKIQKVGT